VSTPHGRPCYASAQHRVCAVAAFDAAQRGEYRASQNLNPRAQPPSLPQSSLVQKRARLWLLHRNGAVVAANLSSISSRRQSRAPSARHCATAVGRLTADPHPLVSRLAAHTPHCRRLQPICRHVRALRSASWKVLVSAAVVASAGMVLTAAVVVSPSMVVSAAVVVLASQFDSSLPSRQSLMPSHAHSIRMHWPLSQLN
jgi:hypothetical protein